MLDSYTLQQCRKDKMILEIKITNIQHGIKKSEEMISESKLDVSTLSFLRRQIANSMQDLEVLYLLKEENEKSFNLKNEELK